MKCFVSVRIRISLTLRDIIESGYAVLRKVVMHSTTMPPYVRRATAARLQCRQGLALTVCYIAPKVLPNNNMPCRAIFSVELLLDLRRDVLLDVVLFESRSRNFDGLLLHLLAHINILDDGFGAVPSRVSLDGARVGRRWRVGFVC